MTRAEVAQRVRELLLEHDWTEARLHLQWPEPVPCWRDVAAIMLEAGARTTDEIKPDGLHVVARREPR